MALIPRTRAFLRNVFRRSRADQELADELQSFSGLVEDEARARGTDATAARSLGRRAIGNTAATTEAVRQARAGAGFERLWQDLTYAARMLRRTPGFTALTVLILTLGIGSVTTMFGVVDAALFKPLPYASPDQLVSVGEVLGAGTPEETTAIGVTWKEIDWWRSRPDVFSQIVTYRGGRPAVIADVPVSGATFVGRVSPELLQLFGVRPRLGRWFATSDGELPVVLLSESFWRHGFGSDPAVVGRTVTIDRTPCTIVGVMPATFAAAVGGVGTVAWRPFDESVERQTPESHASTVFRIRDGLDLAQAQRAAQLAARNMPGASSTFQVKLLPLDTRQWLKTTNQLLLPVMLGVVALVLLIACANVANLLLARAVTRRRELAVRAALGASRGRLIRQLITEGFALAVLGGSVGVGLAALATRILPDALPARLQLFAINPMELDVRVLAVSAAAVVITTLLCSVLPAMRASRTQVLDALEGGMRAVGSRSGQRLRYGLQVIEIALTLVLVCGTTLLASSFIHMVWTPNGYRLDGLATASLALPSRYPTPALQRAFFDRLIADIRHVPGVESATFGFPPPGGSWGSFTVKGQEQNSGVPFASSSLDWIGPDYLAVVGIPIKTGRGFDDTDFSTSPPVGLIDEDTAHRYWPGTSPIGQQFRYSRYVPWITIVGVTGRVKTTAFTSPNAVAEVFLPQTQNSSQAYRTLTFRSNAADPLAPIAGVRAALRALDPDVDLKSPKVVADLYDDVFVQPRLYVVLMSVFAGLSALTAAVGLFGLLNYSVSQRQREIGVRLALGAAMGDIRRLVVRDAAAAVVGGLAIGLAGALLLARLLQTIIFGISIHDATSFAVAVAVMAALAAASTILPARRAARVDPVRALRVE
jgi:putative ABC transport system permease protein